MATNLDKENHGFNKRQAEAQEKIAKELAAIRALLYDLVLVVKRNV